MNPTVLSAATQFRPISRCAQSQSPSRSRSPVRRNEFIAKELDPILANLSPDSTLRALESTDAIASGSAQEDALAKGIAEASPQERELGIKAALAAQLLRQWHTEVAQWPWPGPEESRMGLGFWSPEPLKMSAQGSASLKHTYVGPLPLSEAMDYEERVEEIYAGLDALDIEELKDAVLDSHSSFRSAAVKDSAASGRNTSWRHSHIKDFTALITATFIQALPDLANLNALLGNWDTRLTILRGTPRLLEQLQSTQAGLNAASGILSDPKLGPLVKREEVETTENLLAVQVSSLGTQIDQMLDLLEGREDSLPNQWIDTLDKIENDFSQFVVEAKRRVLHNEWLARMEETKQASSASATPAAQIDGSWAQQSPISPVRFPSLRTSEERSRPASRGGPSVPSIRPARNSSSLQAKFTDDQIDSDGDQTPLASQVDKQFVFPLQTSHLSQNSSQRKPNLTVDTPQTGHRREISEVSMADSAYSAFSDISKAEIVDATSTQVLMSPKVSLIDNPFRASRDDLSSYGHESKPRVQSMHILGKDAYTRVEGAETHSRSKSMSISDPPPQYETQASLPVLPAGLGDFSPVLNPSDTADRPLNLHRASTASIEMLQRGQARQIMLARPPSRNSSLLLSEDLEGIRSPSENLSSNELQLLDVPRRSSKRISREISNINSHEASSDAVFPTQSDDEEALPEHGQRYLNGGNPDHLPSTRVRKAPDGSLEAKIQSILTTLPTLIRLAGESDSPNSSSNPATVASSRSSTPAPFTLSPVRSERSARRGVADESGVQVYHLTRSGQSRDTPPTKLFVRLVGEYGERVMVRVGGGWADLGEYLREYSLHHGRRGISDGRFEVANLPSGGQIQRQRETAVASSPATPVLLSRSVTEPVSDSTRSRYPSASSPDTGFDFGALPNINIPKARQQESNRFPDFTPEFRGPSADEFSALARGPVPAFSSSHTTYAPASTTTTHFEGDSASNAQYPSVPTSSVHSRTTAPDSRNPSTMSSTTTTPTFSSSTTFYSPPSSTPNYTPLGAAGPKTAGRRATTYGALSTGTEHDSWVEGLVGQARAVSGSARMNGPSAASPGPFSTPANRRVSGALNSSPMSAQSNSSHISALEKTSPSARTRDRPGNSGAVSGIRRVFLRKKPKQ